MKKKIITAVLTAIIALQCVSMAGCNKQIFDLNYEFKNAYVKIGDEWVDLEIKTWTDYEDGEQIQLILMDGTVLVVHSENCILYNGELPKEKENENNKKLRRVETN